MHYVMADLHGEYGRFRRMLDRIAFSDGDTLYILGDAVDRGGAGGVDILLDVMARPNVVMLLGNHEAMCLRTFDEPDNQRAVNHWRRNGGQVTHDALFRLPEQERGEVLDFLRARPDHLDLEVDGRRFHLVHGFPADNTYDRVWLRPGPEAVSPFPDGRIVIAGHTLSVSCGTMMTNSWPAICGNFPAGRCGSFAGRAISTWTAAAAMISPSAVWPACGWRIWRNFIRKKPSIHFYKAIS